MIGLEDLTIDDTDFNKISKLIRCKYGINLSGNKKTMLGIRLRKRLSENDCRSFSEYTSYLFSDQGLRDEIAQLIDEVTTNKTDFFRESRHFDYLVDHILPDWYDRHITHSESKESFHIWSAACSTGEEPYTIAMLLSEFARQYPEFTHSVIASDISSRVLDHARRGIYEQDRIEPVPTELRKRYFGYGTGNYEGKVRLRPEIRNSVRFDRVNLMDPPTGSSVYDVVFLRNVIIYFDRETKRQVISRVLETLRPGGHLFVGHSETLFDMDLPFEVVQPNIYRKIR